MDTSVIPVIAAAILSLLFEYVPGFSGWFGALMPEKKRLFMLVVTVVGTVGLGIAHCYTPVLGDNVCTNDTFWDLAVALVLAITANQGVHRVTKK